MLPMLRNFGKRNFKIDGFGENIWGRSKFSGGKKNLDLVIWGEIHPKKMIFPGYSASNFHFFWEKFKLWIWDEPSFGGFDGKSGKNQE